MTSDEMVQLAMDITLGRPAPPNESPEWKAARARLTAQIDEIKAKGGVVDLPREIP